MSNVAILPTPLARAAQASANPRNISTCGIYDVAGRLGQAHRQPHYICKTIDRLIEQRGFPHPFPLLRGEAMLERVLADSRWPRAAVEAWFNDQLPPAARALDCAAEHVERNSRLAVNLGRLFEEEVA
ncbi:MULTISPECIES: hypothetical protein [unclassified Sphingomonas]|uniref:hypothetical protein n=1 Tax=unclassified Sphingomonas TaxID=196159 RepID=UPI00092A84AF|nr:MULTISPECIES: hypothetical protein [unclassified Sphingomonas]MBN8848175.1 hypothetical protein [Sphingomonas sp.]OJV30669.1 MAG: hypothetical protein BGO24_08110 [Sphingomonas sp. 67-36]